MDIFRLDFQQLGWSQAGVNHYKDDIYFVEGKWLYRLMQSVNFDDYESLNYFQNVLINSGVIDALREAGIEEGDTVSIYEVQFEFMD